MYILSSLQGAEFFCNEIWLHKHKGAMTKRIEVYNQYLFFGLYFTICSLCIYWAPCRELEVGAPGESYIFSQRDLGSLYIKELWQSFQKSRINICIVVCILVYYLYWFFSSKWCVRPNLKIMPPSSITFFIIQRYCFHMVFWTKKNLDEDRTVKKVWRLS